MNLISLCNKLDLVFDISNLPPDMPFSRSMPRIYDLQKIEFRKYLTTIFLEKFNGLMLKNSDDISNIFLTVFLSEEILDKVFSKNINNCLVFTHHPMGMETSNRGFLPASEKYFQEMKNRKISVYSMHTGLDINNVMSTSLSIANELNLKNLQRYNFDGLGYYGVCGEFLVEKKFNDFILILKTLFGIDDIHYESKFEYVKKIGIIAGGGADVKYIKETIALGCDTYLSGDYVNKITNEYSVKKRKEFEEIQDKLDINLIECSHYATEKIVILNDINRLFKKYGLKTDFVEQDNPWY